MFILYLGLSLGYHVFYAVSASNPLWSARARMHSHRLNWIQAVLKRGERIMAVQALRNLIMTNTFLASTMILMVAFIANFLVSDPKAQEFLAHESDWLAGAMPLMVKGILLLLLYSFAFTMFLTSLRALNHLSILVGLEPDQIQATEQRDPSLYMADKLNQVEQITTYGRRAVYFSIPVFAWIFSPWLFGVATIAIWCFFVLVTDFIKPLRRRQPAPGTPPTASPSPSK